MNSRITHKITTAAALLIASIAVSGCATSARSIDSGAELANAALNSQEALVFGKFTLQRNGEAVTLSESPFGNAVTMHIHRVGDDKRIAAAIGRDGEFAWALEPGEYTVAKISFMNRGERFEPEADFRFSVSADSDTVYIGTIALESTFEYGYYGLNGTDYSYRIANHCESDCADRLSRLGRSSSEPVVAMLTPQNRIVGAR